MALLCLFDEGRIGSSKSEVRRGADKRDTRRE